MTEYAFGYERMYEFNDDILVGYDASVNILE